MNVVTKDTWVAKFGKRRDGVMVTLDSKPPRRPLTGVSSRALPMCFKEGEELQPVCGQQHHLLDWQLKINKKEKAS